jgi:hypothetical protein
MLVVRFLVLVAAFLLLFQRDLAAAGTQWIIFKPGQTSAMVEGRFSKDVTAVYYSLHARAGQHMRVNIRPLTPTLITAGVVISPSGKEDGGPGGLVFDSDLSETGVYRIRVTQRQSRVEGVFRLEVAVKNAVNRGTSPVPAAISDFTRVTHEPQNALRWNGTLPDESFALLKRTSRR